MSELVLFFLFFCLVFLADQNAWKQQRTPDVVFPELIVIDESTSYFFDSSSSVLEDEFRDWILTDLSKRVSDAAEARGYTNPIVEVIGFADKEIYAERSCSNLDANLEKILRGEKSFELRGCWKEISVADNAGIGLARAAQVVSALRSSPALKEFKFQVFSGAHINSLEGGLDLEGGGRKRNLRRVEVRVRQPYSY